MGTLYFVLLIWSIFFGCLSVCTEAFFSGFSDFSDFGGSSVFSGFGDFGDHNSGHVHSSGGRAVSRARASARNGLDAQEIASKAVCSAFYKVKEGKDVWKQSQVVGKAFAKAATEALARATTFAYTEGDASATSIANSRGVAIAKIFSKAFAECIVKVCGKDVKAQTAAKSVVQDIQEAIAKSESIADSISGKSSKTETDTITRAVASVTSKSISSVFAKINHCEVVVNLGTNIDSKVNEKKPKHKRGYGRRGERRENGANEDVHKEDGNDAQHLKDEPKIIPQQIVPPAKVALEKDVQQPHQPHSDAQIYRQESSPQHTPNKSKTTKRKGPQTVFPNKRQPQSSQPGFIDEREYIYEKPQKNDYTVLSHQNYFPNRYHKERARTNQTPFKKDQRSRSNYKYYPNGNRAEQEYIYERSNNKDQVGYIDEREYTCDKPEQKQNGERVQIYDQPNQHAENGNSDKIQLKTQNTPQRKQNEDYNRRQNVPTRYNNGEQKKRERQFKQNKPSNYQNVPYVPYFGQQNRGYEQGGLECPAYEKCREQSTRLCCQSPQLCRMMYLDYFEQRGRCQAYVQYGIGKYCKCPFYS